MGIAMSTLVGWAAVLGIFGAYGFREWSKSTQAQLARSGAQQRQRQERINSQIARKEPKEVKPKRARVHDAPKPPVQVVAPAQPPANHSYSYSSDDDAASNREFARQLVSVKQGTKFTGKAVNDTRQKSVKQSRAEEFPTSGDSAIAVSAPSSTAGIDADDDRSSAASPVLVAAVAGNVDDMLEKSAPGPSVLRLTASEDVKPAKEKKAKSAPEPAETKKQRQNRKKVEQAKIAREEAEVERKAKLEAQRRTARIAEGRAAKDGSAFMAAQAQAANAWKSNGVKPAAANGISGEASLVQTDTSKSSTLSVDKTDDWMSSLPSEEEQMEMLRKEDEDSWSTVKPKSRKTKTVEPSETAPTPAAAPASAKVAAQTAAPTVNAPIAVVSTKTKVFTHKSSFAALTTEETAEEEEAEWDV